MKNLIDDWRIIVMACLTLGLAPFVPQPHVLGKLKWVLGGAVGMRAMDWFDLLMLGMPFLLLIRILLLYVLKIKIK